MTEKNLIAHVGVKTAEDVANLTAKQLVDFYNLNRPDEKPIKKFETPAIARARCVALLAATPTPRARGIKESWKRPEVAAARATRVGAKVDGVVYASMQRAFAALGIPAGRATRARMKLKEKGRLSLVHEGKTYDFKAVKLG